MYGINSIVLYVNLHLKLLQVHVFGLAYVCQGEKVHRLKLAKFMKIYHDEYYCLSKNKIKYIPLLEIFGSQEESSSYYTYYILVA